MPTIAAEVARAANDVHARARMLPRLLLTAAILGVVFATVAGLVIRQSRQSYEARATETATWMAAVAHQTLQAEFGKIDAMLQATLDQLTSDGIDSSSDQRKNRLLQGHRQYLPELEALRMADANGRVRWGNDLPPGTPVDVSDRAYFKRARDVPEAGLIVGGPLQSRASGRWIIVLARPKIVDGRFDGIAYATVSADHLGKILERFDLGTGDAITLRTTELALVARHAPGSNAKPAIGAIAVSEELKSALAQNPDKGDYSSQVAVDGVLRTTAYRRLEGLPFLVLTGLAHDRFFEPWRTLAAEVSALAALAWLISCAALYSLYRSWRRGARLVDALTTQTLRMQALMRIAGDGIHIMNSSGQLVEMSDSFAEMLGSTREKLLGRHISSWDANMTRADVDRWLAKIKGGDKRRVDARHLTDDGRVIDVDLHVSVADISGERFIFASSSDITERKRLQTVLEQSSARVRDLYDNAPCGYVSLNREGLFVHANATMLRWLGCDEQDLLNKVGVTEFLDDAGRATFAESFKKLQREGRIDGVELKLIVRNRAPQYVRVSSVAIRNEAGDFVMSRSALLDVTPVHDAQLETARVLQEQSAMLDNDIVGMARLSRDVIVWKNRALDRMLGHEPGDLADASIERLFVSRSAFEATVTQANQAFAKRENFRCQIQMKRKDAGLVWVDLSGVQLADGFTFWTLADITAMRQAHERIEHLAFHDELTGLANRLLLNDRLQQAIALVRRDGGNLAVCYLDLDGFKPINDEHGHDAGDTLLREIASRLGKTVRAIDTVARVGGDEFVVLLLLDELTEDWETAAQRLMEAVARPVTLSNGTAVHVGMSVGVALCPKDGFDGAALVDRADRALLLAKRTGKGRIRAYSPALAAGSQ